MRSIFVVSHQQRKFFNIEIFPNYGSEGIWLELHVFNILKSVITAILWLSQYIIEFVLCQPLNIYVRMLLDL